MLSNREDLPGLESSTRFPLFHSSSSYPLLKMHQYLVVPSSNLRDSAQNDNKEIEISSLSTFRSNSNYPDSRQQFSADHMAQQPQTLITGKRGERGEYFVITFLCKSIDKEPIKYVNFIKMTDFAAEIYYLWTKT